MGLQQAVEDRKLGLDSPGGEPVGVREGSRASRKCDFNTEHVTYMFEYVLLFVYVAFCLFRFVSLCVISFGPPRSSPEGGALGGEDHRAPVRLRRAHSFAPKRPLGPGNPFSVTDVSHGT